eukprot:TRINITY_DN3311_c5_g1_i1.p1 TRINITY_DN3311_c5_g1~~TRINITY_DN3311_c5_g1_i1.p1  ORF type:complete len:307 (-),score=35.59 TRINITY_DN3311_c5_g1_i1:107-949(-)
MTRRDNWYTYAMRTVGIGAGVGAVGLVAVGPLAAIAGVGATLYARTNAISLAVAFNSHFDHRLRKQARDGRRFCRMIRFSRQIQRIASSFGCSAADGTYSDPGHTSTVRRKEDLPTLVHSGIILEFDAETGPKQWMKIEYAKEGLQVETHHTEAPQIDSSYFVETCLLQDVSPAALADCLRQRKNHTYNALTWNCNHVADIIWDDLLIANGGRGPAVDPFLFPGPDAQQDNSLCKICLDRCKSIAFVPCGHYETCAVCAVPLESCPFCNEAIQTKQRIFG